MQNLHICAQYGYDRVISRYIDATQQTFFDEAFHRVVIEPITFDLNDFDYFSKSRVLRLGT